MKTLRQLIYSPLMVGALACDDQSGPVMQSSTDFARRVDSAAYKRNEIVQSTDAIATKVLPLLSADSTLRALRAEGCFVVRLFGTGYMTMKGALPYNSTRVFIDRMQTAVGTIENAWGNKNNVPPCHSPLDSAIATSAQIREAERQKLIQQEEAYRLRRASR